MLDTIIIGLIILSALVYGFWQYFAEPDDAHKKKKNEANKRNDDYIPKDNKSSTEKKLSETTNTNNKTNINKNSKRSNLKKRTDKTNYSHNWLLTTLKGHTGSVMDMSFSANGKYLATCADDRTILIWYTRDLYNAKDRKTFRINVEYDHVYKLVWSPDSKAILGFKAMDNSIEVYRLERKEGSFTSYGRSITFPRAHENDDVISLDIACNGRFIMSASNKTELIIWDIRGNVLEQLNTFTMSNYCAKISPCGRFVGVSGYAPDVKFWEVKFGKTGSYEKTVKAFDLVGHHAGVWDFGFDQDASHCVTVCKDGYWRLFDINIDYARGESPRCLLTGEYESKAVSPLIALSNSAHVITIGCGNNIQFFSGLNGNLDNTIENVFIDHIMSIAFDSLGLQLYVAGDRQVRVFHNITGYKVGIEVAKEKLKDKKTTAATRERLEGQIVEYENFIAQNFE